MVPSFLVKRKWILLLCILAGIVAFIVYHYQSQLWSQAVKLYDIYQDHHQLKKVISSFGPYAPLAYILLQIIQVVVAPIPGGAIEFLGGYLFGVSAGMVYSMIGLILGSWLAFSLARIFEKIAVEKFVSFKPSQARPGHLGCSSRRGEDGDRLCGDSREEGVYPCSSSS